MRLDRYLSQGTGIPRREVGPLVRRGRVMVQGELATVADQQVMPSDVVLLDGKLVRAPGHLVLMLHKPAGYVSTTEDKGKTVMELVPEALRHRDLAPIGRLDKDTTGLLLLTTDGALSHALTSPRRHVDKSYLAVLESELAADAETRFAEGIPLADGSLCRPAGLERLEPLRVRITLREGKFHQVKRMVAACGSSVVSLHRERIGPLWLDPELAEGEVRALSPDEIAALAG